MKVMAHQGLVQPIANTVSGVNGVVGVVSPSREQARAEGRQVEERESQAPTQRRAGGLEGYRRLRMDGCDETRAGAAAAVQHVDARLRALRCCGCDAVVRWCDVLWCVPFARLHRLQDSEGGLESQREARRL